MKRLSLLFFIISAFLLCRADSNDFSALYPEKVNARSVGFERFHDLLIVYSIHFYEDNTIEAYRITETPDGYDLAPVGAFRENTVRDYRPLALPSPARIVGLNGQEPKFVSDKVTLDLDMENRGRHIAYNNKEMLMMYADFLDHPEDYPGLDPSPIPDHVEQLRDLYMQRLSRQRTEAKEQAQDHKDSLSDANRWFSIALVLPLALLIWLMSGTSGHGIAVDFHGKIRTIALVGLLSFGMSIASMITFPLVNWPYIVLGAALMLVCAGLFLIICLRAKKHIAFARYGKFPTISAACFGIIGLFTTVGIVYSFLALVLNASGAITLSSETSASDIMLGIVLSLIILVALGFWYYKSLISKAPQLGRSFLWIALATILAFLAAAMLILIVIALAIFHAPAGTSAGESNGTFGGNGRGQDCSRCRHSSMGGCSIYSYYSRPTFNCPHYNPN